MNGKTSGISRRTFLVSAAATGAALTGLAGCASESNSSSGSTSSAGASTESTSSAADFAIEPIKASAAGNPIKECDYLVIGGGNCGMMSAAYAGSQGLNTILVEKSSVTGGSSVGTEVTMAFSDCKIMQECADDPNVVNMSAPTGSNNDIFTYFMMHNSWEANAELVTNYIQNNHRQHDFLYENGGYPMMLLPALDAPTGGIMYEGQGAGAFEVMQKAAEDNDVEIVTNCPAQALVVDDDGAVVGAMVDLDGTEGYIKAKAVFVGTGGFSNHVEMVDHYIPGYGSFAWKRDSFLAHDGDGIRMMFGVGAVESDMSFAQPAASSVQEVQWDTPIDKAAREPYLWVNANGERLGNEKWTVMDAMFKVGIKENNYTYFNVIDTAAVKRMETEPLMTSARTVLGSMDPVSNMGQELDQGVESGDVYKGDTLDELAQAAGIEAQTLTTTVEAYNKMVELGQDTQFYKDSEALFSIKEGPFYAFKLIPSWYSTLCGVKINGNIEVVNADGKAIPGLYAGGLDTGEFYKDNYNHGFSGGCSGYSYFTGFYAVDQVKKYIGTV